MITLHFTSVWLYIWIPLVLHQSPVVDGSCQQIVRYITHSMRLQSRLQPNIEGEWTSSRCEVRPGPKFVTRFIRVFANSTWLGRFHHYSDYQCTKPTFTLLVKGFYQYGEASRNVKGGTAATFNFTLIRLYPFKDVDEAHILKVTKKSCPGTLTNIKADPGVGVYNVRNNAFSRRTCRSTFGISDYEFSVLKLESRKKLSSKSNQLYFAEIPTAKSRRRYTPTCYQLPLKKYNAPNCSICMLIRSASAIRPPIIPKVRPRPVMLDDAWGSTTCESRPGNSFLTRYMVFHYTKGHWEGYFYYFHDSQCRNLNFLLYCKGVFSGGSRSAKVRDGEDYVFTVTEASITPYDKTTTRQLNSMSRNNECGKDGEWVTGSSQDITQSKGCRLLGIHLPHTEYDLLKMVTNENGDRELYVGQRPSDKSSPTSPDKRPTSYQIPMLKCSAFRMEFVPPTTQPTTAPTTRFPKPRVINPILTVPTLKRDGDKTTPKRKDKTSKGTKGSSTNGVTVSKVGGSSAKRQLSMPIAVAILLVFTSLL